MEKGSKKYSYIIGFFSNLIENLFFFFWSENSLREFGT